MSSAGLETRVGAVERDLAALGDRVAALEGSGSVRPAQDRPTAVSVVARTRNEAEAPARARRIRDLERLVGGRLLALVGGVAVILAATFFVNLAIERGWLGPAARVALAAAASAGLLALGAWLYERRGATQASLATAGAGVAGLYVSLFAAAPLYQLVPGGASLVGAALVGAVATGLAVRWSAQPIAGLGIVGGLLAPVVLHPSAGVVTLLFLATAYAAGTAVLLSRGWDWLAVVAFAVTMPQVGAWAVDDAPTGTLVAVLATFAVLTLAAATGVARRASPLRARPLGALLSGLNALWAAALGVAALDAAAARWWLLALAATHAAAALAAHRLEYRTEHAGGVPLAATAVALAALTLGQVSARPQAGVWAALLLIAVLTTQRLPDVWADASRAGVAAFALLGNAALYVFGPDAPEGGLLVAVLTGFAAAVFACARIDRAGHNDDGWDSMALLLLAGVNVATLSGLSLLAVLAIEMVLFTRLAAGRTDRASQAPGQVLFSLAALRLLFSDVPLSALADGARSLPAAAAAIGVVIVAAVVCALLAPRSRDRVAWFAAAAATTLYFGSVAIVTVTLDAPAWSAFGLDAGQRAQVALSAWWSVCGAGAVWLGLRRDRQLLRGFGFSLLSLAVLKVFLHDLGELDTGYRVLSLLLLGLLLLGAAFAYQRLRPANDRPSSDEASPAPRAGARQ